jgi:hypothetical protein
MVPAEPGWRALYAKDGVEVGRSRVIAWAALAVGSSHEVVGLVVDPRNPRTLVPAAEAVASEGEELLRYGFAEPPVPKEPARAEPPPPQEPPQRGLRRRRGRE